MNSAEAEARLDEAIDVLTDARMALIDATYKHGEADDPSEQEIDDLLAADEAFVNAWHDVVAADDDWVAAKESEEETDEDSTQ